MREAVGINSSLLVLGKVISSLGILIKYDILINDDNNIIICILIIFSRREVSCSLLGM